MGYQAALEATGLTIKTYETFGSYQGTWIAVTSDNQFIEGSYGSCSGCDAFEAEFGWRSEEPTIHEGKYYKGYYWDENEITKEEYGELVAEEQTKLAQFGQSYANSTESYEEILARYKRKIDDEYAWSDDEEIYKWLLEYSI